MKRILKLAKLEEGKNLALPFFSFNPKKSNAQA
jgi:hypothetical protein